MYCKYDPTFLSRGGKLCGVCTEMTPIGGPCPDGVRCVEKGICDAGQCVARVPMGRACTDATACVYPLDCIDGVCTPPANASQPLVADGARLGEVCDASSVFPCGADVTLACLEGRCQLRGEQGEHCASPRDCRAGMRCDDGECSAPVDCQLDAGADCGIQRCGRGMFCIADDAGQGHCQAIVYGHAEGDPCVLLCDSHNLLCSEGRCVRVETRTGAACSSPQDCPGGACERDIAPYCQFNRPLVHCVLPECDGCGTCVERPSAADCGPAP